MPKAEVGSTKYIANKMKAKGLQRLRWYCQICAKQCRDENGFKQHTLSEGHVRAMLLVGEDPKKYIEDYSRQFKRDFLQLLKTSHGEKMVSLNGFYQEYIRDKEHVHMNATKWSSLTEFAKMLGQEGICRVLEGERGGLEVGFVDDSPEAVRRREDVRRKERLAKGDEELESRMLERQIRAAREERERREREAPSIAPKAAVDGDGEPVEPVKVSMSLGGKVLPKQKESSPKEQTEDAPVEITEFSSTRKQTSPPAVTKEAAEEEGASTAQQPSETINNTTSSASATAPLPPTQQQHPPPPPAKPSLSLAGLSKPKSANPLMAKKNPLSKKKDASVMEPEKKMSNAERIMREEMEAKRKGGERGGGGGGGKRMRLG